MSTIRSPWVVATGAVLMALAISGCSAGSREGIPDPESSTASPVPTPTPAPAVAGPASYSSIEELRLGFVAETGEECPPLSQYYDNPDGVICSEGGWQLFWFSDIESRNRVLQLNVDSIEPSPFVVGPTWLINSTDGDYPTIAVAMNATVWTSELPIPTS